MSFTQWRTLGISAPAFVDVPSIDQNFYDAIGLDWVILRTLVSVTISAQVIEQPLITNQPMPIVCQVSNFDGPDGTAPPAIGGDPHPLVTMMPTLYPGPAIGIGDVLLPVITRLWVGGTGGQPISTAGRRRGDGIIGGPHIALQAGWANDSPVDPSITTGAWSICWSVAILVQRP